MRQITHGLLKELHSGLQQILQEAENKLQLAERSLRHTNDIIKRLKEHMHKYKFENVQEEIDFFKEIKPSFQREFFYFEALYNVESRRPIGTEESIKIYYASRLGQINDYFEQNRVFYLYYLSGAVNNDEIYYTRNPHPLQHGLIYIHDLDHQFSTPYSAMLAKIQAYESLKDYLDSMITGNDQLQAAEFKGPYWSAKDVDFVEAAAALYYSGSVNHGKGGFTKFINQLAAFFNVKLHNVPRVIYGMSIRKKAMAPFLTAITEEFLKFLADKSA